MDNITNRWPILQKCKQTNKIYQTTFEKSMSIASKNLISGIMRRQDDKVMILSEKKTLQLMHYYRSIVQRLGVVVVKHNYRETNKVVDMLAKEGTRKKILKIFL
ncbi:PREDICTED: uncharacterized protein LOC109217291 [Nicotiana attenuata]|uniref:uncharacterized protein LOC109217291 n=1 Tax=Nicotiana attenuata TaxID=49451 RepID=UPI0009052B8A|nr:PREDICTED: uncharacterized protein LOC109217291 [Nicotiana attenuata]